MKVEVRAWLAIFNFWLKLIFLLRTLTSLLFVDNYHPTWKRALSLKVKTYGLSMKCLIQADYEMAKQLLKQRILVVERHCDLGATSNNILTNPALIPFKPANYFFAHLTKNQRRAFTLARMNALPSAIQEGKFHKIPYSHRKCLCRTDRIQTLVHVFLHCPLYDGIREKLIAPYLKQFPGWPEAFYTGLLLSEQNIYTEECPTSSILSNVAKFCAAAIIIHAQVSAIAQALTN
ncbi:hypothetical protein JRQ81_000913 [Phrynocephalus forsythii]|uniref:Uncharacterized protein n=1 Tax=Phrynocephalus forsythii TaxID=171643 RepID=A0A9Q0Y713_9SAUR|nr:hypothetical protein JRQ81_000913 [Phrynocephalus forsythii]